MTVFQGPGFWGEKTSLRGMGVQQPMNCWGSLDTRGHQGAQGDTRGHQGTPWGHQGSGSLGMLARLPSRSSNLFRKHPTIQLFPNHSTFE